MQEKTTTFSAAVCLVCLVMAVQLCAEDGPDYRSETNIVYSTVAGKALWLNAFTPVSAPAPLPAMVEIHGGWWSGGRAAAQLEQVGGWQFYKRHGLAVFSVEYRLGREGGFPENIRDCRNAIRFLRQNAKRFNIDPTHWRD